jgi:hypothetical protein
MRDANGVTHIDGLEDIDPAGQWPQYENRLHQLDTLNPTVVLKENALIGKWAVLEIGRLWEIIGDLEMELEAIQDRLV